MRSRVTSADELSARKKRKIMIAGLISLALLIMISIFGYQKFTQVAAGNVSASAIESTSNNKKIKQTRKPKYDFNGIEEITPQSLAYAKAHMNEYKPIGQIASDHKNLDFDLNIYQGVGNVELNLGAGSMKQNQQMGLNNYAVAGHNMHDHRYFSNVYWSVKKENYKGKIIALTDFQNIYYYKITEASFITKDRIDLTENSQKFAKTPVLSLFTCDWSGNKRAFMRGELVDEISWTNATSNQKNLFKH